MLQGFYEGLRKGSPVEVFYMKRDPADSMVEPERQLLRSKRSEIVSMGLMFLGAVGACWSAWKLVAMRLR